MGHALALHRSRPSPSRLRRALPADQRPRGAHGADVGLRDQARWLPLHPPDQIEIAYVYEIYGCQPPAEPRAKPSLMAPSRCPPRGLCHPNRTSGLLLARRGSGGPASSQVRAHKFACSIRPSIWLTCSGTATARQRLCGHIASQPGGVYWPCLESL
jgi:hypothetical protein